MLRWIAIGLACAAMGGACAADIVYVATAPTAVGGAQSGARLFSMELPSGPVTVVGALLADGKPLTVSGMALHPISGVLYGITSESSPHHPGTLVTIDLQSGNTTVVGRLDKPGSDIAFDAQGTLFMWLRETSQLGSVDTATARVTPVGPVQPASEPGGITLDANGMVYVISSGGAGSVDHVDPITGVTTRGPTITGAPYAAGINSITHTPDGYILAINSNRGVPAKSLLIRIDPASGQATRLAALPDDSEAVVLLHSPWSLAAFLGSHTGATLLLTLALLAAAAIYIVAFRRSHSS